MTTQHRAKNGTVQELQCMPTVEAYAKSMAGVDRLDQNIRLNKEKKTMRWYGRIETKLRECTLYNAYIIEGTVVNHFPPNKQKRDLLSFWMDVTHELTGGFQTSSYVKVGTFSFPLIPSLLKYRYYFKSYECLNNWPIYK